MRPIPGYEEQYLIDEKGQIFNRRTGKKRAAHLNKSNGYVYVNLWKDGRGSTRAVHRLVAEAYLPNPDNKPHVNHIDSDRANPALSNLEWCTQSENMLHGYAAGYMKQEKNFSEAELTQLLQEFLSGFTMTALAKARNVGLSRLTINLRNYAALTNQQTAFEAELKRQKAVRNTEANKHKQKPVQQLTKDGAVIAEFPSMKAAARALGKSTSGPISNALNPNNSQKTGYGYQWKYA